MQHSAAVAESHSQGGPEVKGLGSLETKDISPSTDLRVRANCARSPRPSCPREKKEGVRERERERAST